MRKIERELRREFPGAQIDTTGSNHYRIVLSNGRKLIVSNSPSDRRWESNMRREARRLLAKS
jgi:hypothetical protein